MRKFFACLLACSALTSPAMAASTIDSLPTMTFPQADSGTPSTSKYNLWMSQNGTDVRATWEQLGTPFQGTVAPSAPFKYQLWWNTSTNPSQLEMYDGSTWIVLDALTSSHTLQQKGVPWLLATDYGVVADGVTANDAALAAAETACSATPGGTLFFPSGQIVLSGTQNITKSVCRWVGASVNGANGVVGGTTINLTSVSQQPFTLAQDAGGIYGINFYWPNQTNGTTVYPALFTDTTSGVAHFWMDHVHVINAYQFFLQSGTSGGDGRWFITNSSMYAVGDLFRIGSVSDFMFSNDVFDPNDWQVVTNFAAQTQTAINAANTTNVIFHMIAPPLSTGITLFASNSASFNWGYGVKMDATSKWDFGYLGLTTQGVQTLLDSSAGGTLTNVHWKCSACSAGRGTGPSAGNAPAFTLGSAGLLSLDDPDFNTVPGSFVLTAGASIYVRDGRIVYGAIGDGGDYYGVRMTAAAGTIVNVSNSVITGNNDIHSHAIKIDAATTGVQVVGNSFVNNNDSLNINLGGGAYEFIANKSTGTVGTNDIITTGTGSLMYSSNHLSKAPQPTVSSCGASSSLLFGDPVSGVISIGTTNPTTSCQLTMPFPINHHACTFTPGTPVTLGASVAGTPSTWTISTGADIHNTAMFYTCVSSSQQ